jgi:hypothetical protein
MADGNTRAREHGNTTHLLWVHLYQIFNIHELALGYKCTANIAEWLCRAIPERSLFRQSGFRWRGDGEGVDEALDVVVLGQIENGGEI